jgi:hypothetical protein
VDLFFRQHGCPVQRAQVSGLRQIAGNEPKLLKPFADKQKERAQKRHQETQRDSFDSEARFWDLVGGLSSGTAPRFPWSLEQMIAQALPEELREPKLPPGAKLSAADQKERAQKKAARDLWLNRLRLSLYPAFFQHFCAEYLYRLARTGEGENRP